MSVIIAAMTGFLHAFIPSIFQLFQDKRDKAQELAILQIQLENNKLNVASKEQEIITQANAQVMQTLYETANKPTGIKWIDAINNMIRPLMALLIIFDYVLVTYLAYIALRTSSVILTAADIVDVLWTTDDRNLFAIITAFYFGKITYEKARS